MSWLDALIMGIVQGLAEYLPISSSGHLEICRTILGLELSGAEALDFDLALHVATVLSTITVLRSEFVPLCRSFFTLRRDENTSYVWKLIVSCIPVGIVGLCFKKEIERFFGSGLETVGICLLVTALLLVFAYISRMRTERRPLRYNMPRDTGRQVGWIDAIVIGISQAIAVLPGLSRSGTTIATGIMLGDNREAVARFSFFMVIIPILGEALLDVKDMLSGEAASESVGALALAIGFVASYIVGCLACRWMLEIVKKGKLVWFALYCAVVGAVCIAW